MDFLGFNKKRAEAMEEMPMYFYNEFHFNDNYKREEGETRIYNLIILDESGSMASIREQALRGANETLETIRSAQKDHPDDHQMVTFVTFDSGGSRPDVRAVIDTEKIENVKELSTKQYNPNGCTPLFDAMGLSITALKRIVKKGDHVLVTVITDGFENSSHIYTGAMIKKMVEALSAEDWVFTYIGANQDSEQAASGLGIRSSMDFEASQRGSAMMWDKMNSGAMQFYKKVRRQKESGEAMDFSADFFGHRGSETRITPHRLGELTKGQVLVYGSNEATQGRGLQDGKYAIPTAGKPIRDIEREVTDFILFADSHPELIFFVTRLGCDNTPFRDEDIAPFFAKAYSLPNVYLPAEYWKVLTFKYNM